MPLVVTAQIIIVPFFSFTTRLAEAEAGSPKERLQAAAAALVSEALVDGDEPPPHNAAAAKRRGRSLRLAIGRAFGRYRRQLPGPGWWPGRGRCRLEQEQRRTAVRLPLPVRDG